MHVPRAGLNFAKARSVDCVGMSVLVLPAIMTKDPAPPSGGVFIVNLCQLPGLRAVTIHAAPSIITVFSAPVRQAMLVSH